VVCAAEVNDLGDVMKSTSWVVCVAEINDLDLFLGDDMESISWVVCVAEINDLSFVVCGMHKKRSANG